MENIINKIKAWYRKLPEKKHYVEFITAILSVPVMITVIILNLNNLTQQKNINQKLITDEKITPIQVIINGVDTQNGKNEPTVTASQSAGIPSITPTKCISEVGPVSILSPRENEVVTKDPVCIAISTESDYCSVTWSYRLDSGDWSDFSNKNICLHNLENGNKILQLKIKSTSSEDEVTLQRSFIYQGNVEPTSNPDATSSSGI